jgi:hypothetical protein
MPTTETQGLNLINSELIRVEESMIKYTTKPIFDQCTRYDSGTGINDTGLINCLYIAKNIGSFILHIGGDWPDNKILKQSVIELRKRWQDFLDKNGRDNCICYFEYHYLNRILSLWEEHLGVEDKVEKDLSGISYKKNSAWHYAMAQVLLQLAESIPPTIGKKGITIQQSMQQFQVEKPTAQNIYDSMKKMKYYNQKADIVNWDFEQFFKKNAPKSRFGYKDIVSELLFGDEKAILLLNNLPD